MIDVRPTQELRRDFAVWASEHGVNTSSSCTFGVSTDLIAEVPEHLMLGATVNDQPYVPATVTVTNPDAP